MEPFEVLTSESQERMLAIVTPADRAEVERCAGLGVRATVIGIVTAPAPSGGGPSVADALRILDTPGGEVLADVPPLSVGRRPPLRSAPGGAGRLERRRADDPAAWVPRRLRAEVLGMLADTSWVWRQYDHQLFLNTWPVPAVTPPCCAGPPGLPASRRALARPPTQSPLVCRRSPRRHGLTVAESALNVAAPAPAGGPRQLPQLRQPRACRRHVAVVGVHRRHGRGLPGLAIPVIGGNVSLYNESGGADIDPTRSWPSSA